MSTIKTVLNFHFQAIKNETRIAELEAAIADTTLDISNDDFTVVEGFKKRNSVEIELEIPTIEAILEDKRGIEFIQAMYTQSLKSNLQTVLNKFKTPTADDVSIASVIASVLDIATRSGGGSVAKTVNGEVLKVLLEKFKLVLAAWNRTEKQADTQLDLMKARYNKNTLNILVGHLTSRGIDASIALQGTLKNLNEFKAEMVKQIGDNLDATNTTLLQSIDVLLSNIQTYIDAMANETEIDVSDYC